MLSGMTTILVTSIGSMSADCVIRQLRGLDSVRIVGCDLNPAPWLAASARLDGFHRIRSSHDAQAYLDDIRHICTQEHVSHLIALTDPEVDLLSARSVELAGQLGVQVCTPDAAAVGKARDKLALAALFEQDRAVPVIPTLEPESSGTALPLLFKPRRGRSSQGQFVARTAADLGYASQAFRSPDYLAQPLLDGRVFVADVVRHAASGATAVACREELIRTANGAGMSVRTVADATLDAQAIEVARRTGVNGCVNIEFLQVDGRYLLMDFNPRFSAGVAFSVLAGYDMVRAHWDCFQGLPPRPAAIRPGQIFTRALLEQTASVLSL